MNKPLLKSLSFILIYYIGIFIIGAADYHTYYNLHIVNSVEQSLTITRWIFILMPIIVSIIGIILFKPRFIHSLKDYKQNFFKYVIWVILGFLLILIINSLFPSETANQSYLTDTINAFTINQKIGLAFTIVIFGPINEEIIYRQILIGELQKYIPQKWILLILSSIAFGLLHISSIDQIGQSVVYILNGIVIGSVYLKTNDNVIASSSIHWLNNLLGLFFS